MIDETRVQIQHADVNPLSGPRQRIAVSGHIEVDMVLPYTPHLETAIREAQRMDELSGLRHIANALATYLGGEDDTPDIKESPAPISTPAKTRSGHRKLDL